MSLLDKLHVDEDAWTTAFYETPFAFPPADSPEEAMTRPGCAVKERTSDPALLNVPGLFRRVTGKLVVHDEKADLAVVRGWGDGTPWSPKFEQAAGIHHIGDHNFSTSGRFYGGRRVTTEEIGKAVKIVLAGGLAVHEDSLRNAHDQLRHVVETIKAVLDTAAPATPPDVPTTKGGGNAWS